MIRRSATVLALAWLAWTGLAAAAPPRVSVERVGDMVWPRIDATGTLLRDGRTLLTGGSAFSNEAPVPWVEVFDPATLRFEPTGSMNVPRRGHVAVPLKDGRVLVAGGWRAGIVVGTATAETWDPATGLFTRCGDMPIERGDGTPWIELDGGSILLVGGTVEGAFGTATDEIDLFDPSTSAFTPVGHLAMSRRDAGLVRLDADHVLVFGGINRCCDHPASAARETSQEIIDLRTFHSEPAGEWSFEGLRALVGDGSPTLTIHTSHGAMAMLRHEGPGEAGDVLGLGHLEAFPLGERTFMGSEGGVTVFNADGVSPDSVLSTVWDFAPTVIPLGEGQALVAGGGMDLRPCAEAWLVTAR